MYMYTGDLQLKTIGSFNDGPAATLHAKNKLGAMQHQLQFQHRQQQQQHGNTVALLLLLLLATYYGY